MKRKDSFWEAEKMEGGGKAQLTLRLLMSYIY